MPIAPSVLLSELAPPALQGPCLTLLRSTLAAPPTGATMCFIPFPLSALVFLRRKLFCHSFSCSILACRPLCDELVGASDCCRMFGNWSEVQLVAPGRDN